MNWYGVRTRANHEKVAASALESKGYEPYLPLTKQRTRWSDRTVQRDRPLFPGYVFCRFDSNCWMPIVRTSGVVSVVRFGSGPAPIPAAEIEAIQLVVRSA